MILAISILRFELDIYHEYHVTSSLVRPWISRSRQDGKQTGPDATFEVDKVFIWPAHARSIDTGITLDDKTPIVHARSRLNHAISSRDEHYRLENSAAACLSAMFLSSVDTATIEHSPRLAISGFQAPLPNVPHHLPSSTPILLPKLS
jgi:hypothetical protein